MTATDNVHDPAQIGGEIKVDDLAKLYDRKMKTDIRHLFTASHTALRRQDPIGFYQFSGAKAGDDLFYADWAKRSRYETGDQPEFVEAASWISGGARVLDVGCGPGEFARYCPDGYKGIDLNPVAVEAAQAGGRAVFLEQLSNQAAAEYDVVALFQVLEHVEDPLGFAEAAARCVKPGGAMFISVPDRDGIFGTAVNQFLSYPPHHLTWWDEQALRKLFAKLGMDVEKVWREPLRPQHLKTLLYASMYPRRSRHIDFSFGSIFCWVASALLAKLMPSRDRSFVLGHTILMSARKPSTAA